MEIEAGARLGPYEIVGGVGAGGMGEVYRATDTRLGRSVAIKVLPRELAEDRDSVARFEQEARAASALNHPHILHVYDVGEAQVGDRSISYIAMELIEGETLRSLIERKVSLDTTLPWLTQVAEALTKAHESGIVHRDLKPENILVSRDGYAKVVDFGLAKLTQLEELSTGNADAETARIVRTRSGILLGTVGYMSPEQARGENVDHRSDIFSFGCVLFEAATGERPFRGASVVDTLHKVLHDEPRINKELPFGVAEVIRNCLVKSREERYQSMREVAAALRRLSAPTAMEQSHDRRPVVYASIAAALLVAGIVALSMILSPRAKAPIALEPPRQPFAAMDVRKATFTGDVTAAAISGSGRYLAFVRSANDHDTLWLKQLQTGDEIELAKDSRGLSGIRFSPDENWIYFVIPDSARTGSLYRIPAVGGHPTRLVADIADQASLSGAKVAFSRRRALEGDDSLYELLIAGADGTDEKVVYSNRDGIRFPTWSPDGRSIAYVTQRRPSNPSRLEIIDLAPTKVTRRFEGVSSAPLWLPDGGGILICRTWPEPSEQIRFLPLSGRAERRITSDLSSYSSLGAATDARTIATVQRQSSMIISVARGGDVHASTDITPMVSGRSDGVGLSWTRDDRILFLSVEDQARIGLIRPDGSDRRVVVSEPFQQNLIRSDPALSPDGKQIAYTSATDRRLWLVNLDDGNRRPLSNGSGDLFPRWLPDGRSIVFWKNDGKTDLFMNRGYWKIDVESGVQTELLIRVCTEPALSPDGASIAAFCHQKGLMTFSLDGTNERQIATVDDAANVRWTENGKGLEYLSDGAIWFQPLSGEAARKTTEVKGQRISAFAWSPGRTMLAYSVRTSTSDVVLLQDRTPP